MYGQIKIDVGDDFIYKDILNLSYTIKGQYIPSIEYPTENCRPTEYPEVTIKAIVVDGDDYEYFRDIKEITIDTLDLDLGEYYEYSINFDVKKIYKDDKFIVLDVV